MQLDVRYHCLQTIVYRQIPDVLDRYQIADNFYFL